MRLLGPRLLQDAGVPEKMTDTTDLGGKTRVFTPTCRLGVLHPFPDLVSEIFNQGKHLITDLHRILDNSHGVEQGSASSRSQLWGEWGDGKQDRLSANGPDCY